MKIKLPEHVSRIIQTLQANGYEAYAVGGCVRDTLLGKVPQDWDITTSARPEQVKALFSHTVDTGIKHGTVTVMLGHAGYEVTTYRIDGDYEDGRHPNSVTFTGNLEEDLKRRDFTINAMAYTEECGLVDKFEGQRDLGRGTIRCVGDPGERFGEDALRMLRAVRFSAQLGFQVEERTGEAIRALAHTITKVSAERIRTELEKLLLSDHPMELREAYRLGLTGFFLPEFDRMMEARQHNKHHCYTVGEHTLHTLPEIPADRVLRISMLFHDVAKPECTTTDEEGQDHFNGHPKLGADMSKGILRRLKFDNDTIDRVCRLILCHDDRPPLSERNVRRMASRIGPDNMEDLFLVKRADVLAQSLYHRKEKLEYIEEMKAIFDRQCVESRCMKRGDLAVNGGDLIAIGMRPGPELGAVLSKLYEQVLDEPELNTREKLLELAHNFMTPLI